MDKIITGAEKAADPSEQDELFLNPTPMLDELENGPWLSGLCSQTTCKVIF
jgi:hypothetical protein